MADHMTAEQLRAELIALGARVSALEVDAAVGDEASAIEMDLQRIAARVSGMAADTGWISVEDRLPTEKREFQIYYAKYGTQAISEFLPDEDPPSFWHGDPTHWRELPAAPEPPHV